MAKAPEALAQLRENCFVKQQPATQRARGNLARDVIFGWAKTAGCYHHLRASGCILDGFFQPGIVVAHDGFEFYFNADAVQLSGEPETIGIGAVGSKELRTYRDDFGCERFEQRLGTGAL